MKNFLLLIISTFLIISLTGCEQKKEDDGSFVKAFQQHLPVSDSKKDDNTDKKGDDGSFVKAFQQHLPVSDNKKDQNADKKVKVENNL